MSLKDSRRCTKPNFPAVPGKLNIRLREKQYATERGQARAKEREFKSENMVWTRIYYGREVMERIIDTIDVKRALHQRFFLRYMLRAAMAGIIICLMYVFVYRDQNRPWP
mgnify:CR=1 FL=1